MQTLEEYCRRFKDADAAWPELPVAADEREQWWEQWLVDRDPAGYWDDLRQLLPQLLLRPGSDVHSSDAYQRLVMRGEPAQAADLKRAPVLLEPSGTTITIAQHPTGAVPVLTFGNHEDFVLAVRCLAHRCEAVPMQPTVHAQAVSGLIHWGLIRKLGVQARCQILLLHRAPYASLPLETIAGEPPMERWLDLSQTWRLEHELTHIACRRLVGEMRINLFDEIVADAMGMTAAIGHFDADLFRRGLGLSIEGVPEAQARAHVYVSTLEPSQHHQAFQLTLQRAGELEKLLNEKRWPGHSMALLGKLVRGQLTQPFMEVAGSELGSELDCEA
ncbi:hypothetical protein SynBIOSU31_01844 [Synechococcus sp. BIOS-U3-1]|nr:hypothetical protein [Synechococcus sp. BIOS-U3-1]QNI58713.1 hypothetical protein SynBIOSU31_01844 [Synechococcus sp. BIOS-U3-1]